VSFEATEGLSRTKIIVMKEKSDLDQHIDVPVTLFKCSRYLLMVELAY
jgi:hypothetical protein